MKLHLYSVHVRPGNGEREEDVIFVREGFSFWAFLLQPLWALYHRLWLVAALFLAAGLAGDVLTRVLGIAGGGQVAVTLGVAVLIGAEANTLRGWTLKRRGYREVAVVAGSDLEEAELRFFGDRPGAFA